MEKNTTTPNFSTTTEVVETNKDVFLEGTNILRVEKLISTFKIVKELYPGSNRTKKTISKELVSEEEKLLDYPLAEVTPEVLADCRKKGVSYFVLKVDGKLFYSAIPMDIILTPFTILGPHKCAVYKKECRRLSAASDENGGCAKVRGCSKCIERYPWITTGYETFNTECDSFAVVNCSHYEKCPPRKEISFLEANKAKLNLAQLVWDDVKTLKDVERKKRRNGINVDKRR